MRGTLVSGALRLNPWNLGVAAIATLWGFVSVIVAGIDVTGLALVFWRCLIAAATLGVGILALGRFSSLVLRARRAHIAGLSLLLALHWVLFFETLKQASVAVAILLVYTAPIFLAILAPLFLPERRSKVGLIALGVSAPGLVLIALGGEGGTGAEPAAIGLGLGAALTYAFLIIWAKTVVPHVSVPSMVFWQYVLVAVVIAPFLLTGGHVVPDVDEWPWVLALGALLTAVLGVLYLRSLRNVTAQAAGLLAYIEPVSASFLAWAILGEALGWQVVVGGLTVVAGGALVVLYEGVDAPGPEAPAGVRMRA
jgi:drug/metabolite transporter (DMT)-like permease